jgi:hypothetical protein
MSKKFAMDWSSTLKKIDDQNTRKSYKDERVYSPEFNDSGIANAIIRFLPSKDTDIPYTAVYSHNFKTDKGRWFIDLCPTTIKEQCPVCKYNQDNWDSYTKTEQNRKRKLAYYCNILVVKDPVHPENNGKVFLYRFGIKVFQKIMERINPPKGSILDPITVWDWYEGLNFKLIIKKVDIGDKVIQNNYDSSTFEETKTSVGTDEEIEKIISNLYSIKDYTDKSKFSSYETISKKFSDIVLGKANNQKSATFEEAVPEKEKTSGKAEITEEEVISDADDVFSQIAKDNE